MNDVTPVRIDHWRRFRRLMAFMVTIAVIAIAGALWILHRDGVVLHWQFMLALGLGIGVSLLLAGALMGLVFVSANSGHDDEVVDPTAGHR
ncbi:MAG: hypothetical protein ACRYG4_06320 [Janthinobacterium lividum]